MLYTDGVILDVDGTLWDSTVNVVESWRQYAVSHSIPFDKSMRDFEACMGKPMDAFAEAIFSKEIVASEAFDLDGLLQFENEYLKSHGGRVYDGVIETIRFIAEKVPVTIVSNCQTGYIETFLSYSGLMDAVSDHECFGGTGLSKAENIRLVAERNHFAAPVYVGDIQADADAAHKAGIPIVYAAYGFGCISDAEEQISCFPELLKVLSF